MKESAIRKKAIEALIEDGYLTWYPSPVRWKKEIDIFGVFDIVAVYRHKKVLRTKPTSNYGVIALCNSAVKGMI